LGGFQTGAVQDLAQLRSVGRQHLKLAEEHKCYGMEIAALVSLWKRAVLMKPQQQAAEEWLLRPSPLHLLSRHPQRPSFPMAEWLLNH
jgi:hypothetical protein